MAPEWFKALCCIRQPPSPSDDPVDRQVPAPIGAAQPTASIDPVLVLTEVPVEGSGSPSANIGDVRADTVVENTRARSPSNSTGALAPALIEAQPPVPCSPEESTDTPVPAHTEEVAADPAKAREHIDRIDRFRILVMGRANAEIFNGEGEKVDATLVQGSLKAGSEREFDMMKEFVMDHAKTMKLDKRIHAIWFCIPLNESHRMVTAAEKKFFDMCDTGHVPVIVLLTKTDTLALDAIMEVDDGLNEDDAMERAQEEMTAGMQEEGADCATLLTYTANALNEEGLQQLLTSTQQSNLGLCMEFAITKTLKNYMHGMMVSICKKIHEFELYEWSHGRWWKDSDHVHSHPFGLAFIGLWWKDSDHVHSHPFGLAFIVEIVSGAMAGGGRILTMFTLPFEIPTFTPILACIIEKRSEWSHGRWWKDSDHVHSHPFGLAFIESEWSHGRWWKDSDHVHSHPFGLAFIVKKSEWSHGRWWKDSDHVHSHPFGLAFIVRRKSEWSHGRWWKDSDHVHSHPFGLASQREGLMVNVYMAFQFDPYVSTCIYQHPNITHYSSSVHMPTLAISQKPSLQYVAAYGIGAILVFEYLYFLLQANKVNGDLQANLEQAVRTYQTSGVQATVAKLITAAFQCHGEDVEVLHPILVGIAKENQMCQILFPQCQSTSFLPLFGLAKMT
ncbi:hypothetical protein F5J12DRAFT_785097 [Pisolithus orientalis]|uniref:uncharacterized protein n=1 Tax=Pisolithus orientalis TaxID=936130 RepID=UPI00222498F4|nr:uncharacterized protein F5J12DRAFT_785097 [Pisolithus orientalis]KAI5997627.1 hypothetical protein F5J12DRAFT_785097 [Pisolithus orientalis]